jgi:hypothetical protein
MIRWAISFFTHGRGGRLIVGIDETGDQLSTTRSEAVGRRG